jgi:photosystem II stability/assembly factor-like uncharacterized protein
MPAHRLYVGTIGEGVFRSLDGGETFRRACDGMFVECHVRALAVDPRDARRLYLGSEEGLYVSADGADNWQRIDAPLNGLQIWSILLHPANPDLLIVGACPSRLFRSDDGGRTWTEPAAAMEKHCPRIMHTRITTLAAEPTDPHTVWAGVEIDGVWRSRDAGQSWQKVGSGLSSQDIHGIVVIPPAGGRPRRLLATTNNDLNLSDEGDSWRPLKVGGILPHSYCRGLAQLAGRPHEILLGLGDGPPGTTGVIGRSSDAGDSWEVARLPGPANSTIWNFATHAADPQLVYASSVSGQVFRSTDAGHTWTRLAREFGEIRALAWTN